MRETSGQSTFHAYGLSGQLLYKDERKPAGPVGKTAFIQLAGSLVAERFVPAGSSAVVTYQHTDALGTPVATTDQNGAVIRRNRQTAYGEPADGTWERGVGYTGHVVDAGSKLVYMQQRYYDPEVGRFLSVDPVSASTTSGGNFNRYWYANNNPYMFTDPDGRNSVITHMKDGSIKIDIPINFAGPGATASNIAAVESDISSRWTGSYSVGGKATRVNVQVTEVTAATPAIAVNNITLTTGPTSNKQLQGGSFTTGGQSGEWDVTSAGMQNGYGEAAHEGGHLMGAADKYHKNLYDVNGIRITPPLKGFEGNIMAETIPSATTNDTNMQEILSSPRNIQEVEK